MTFLDWSNPAHSLIRTGFLVALVSLLVAPGCGSDSGSGSPIVIDDGPDAGPDAATDAGGLSDPGGTSPSDTGEPPPSDTKSPEPSEDGGTRPEDTSTPPSSGSDGGDSPSDCSTTQRYCHGTCTDVLSDPDNCGSCGFSCSGSASCVNGICKCADGNIRCDGRCVDPTSDDDHCFRCGHACPEGKTCQKSVCVEENLEKAAIEYINQIRQTETDCGQYGVKPAGPTMSVNAELEKAAQAYAERMAEKGFFAHKDPYDGSDFVERVSRTNYRGTVLGENLSRGTRQSAKRMVGGWKGSDSHCRVMTNPDATEMGLGLAHPDSGKFDNYWVLLVGRQ